MGDPFGRAVKDYWENKTVHELIVHSDICDDDEIPVDWLFRSYEEMPELEQKALKNTSGKVLDVGACSGVHALWLQNKGFDVTALDISHLCCEVMKNRGLKKVINADIFEYADDKYDTILLLMNGIGIAGVIDQLDGFIAQLKNLLNPGGKILFDSSDLKYLVEDEEEIGEDYYYGEVLYQLEYDKEAGEGFPWLFIDKDTIKPHLEKAGFKLSILSEGDNYHYLGCAELTK